MTSIMNERREEGASMSLMRDNYYDAVGWQEIIERYTRDKARGLPTITNFGNFGIVRPRSSTAQITMTFSALLLFL